MWGNFPHQLLNHLKYTRYQNEIQPIITNPFWNKIDDKTWFPRGHSYHGYHTAPWQLIVCALFYSGIYFVFIHYWQRYESTLEPLGKQDKVSIACCWLLLKPSLNCSQHETIGMHFLSEHVHNAAVWLLLLYGPFPLNVLHAVLFCFYFPSSFHIKWLFFVVVQTHFPTGNSHRQSALWWTNYASSTLTTWLKSVPPVSSLIFQLLFTSCCKCNIKTSAKTIGQLRNWLGSSFFKFFSLSFLGFVPWSKYKHSQGIFPLLHLPSLMVAMLAPIHFFDNQAFLIHFILGSSASSLNRRMLQNPMSKYLHGLQSYIGFVCFSGYI